MVDIKNQCSWGLQTTYTVTGRAHLAIAHKIGDLYYILFTQPWGMLHIFTIQSVGQGFTTDSAGYHRYSLIFGLGSIALTHKHTGDAKLQRWGVTAPANP